MQFWLGVVAGLSIGWLFDWIAGRRVIRAGQTSDDNAPVLQDPSAPPSPDDPAVTTVTKHANDDDAVDRDAIDAPGQTT